MLQCRTGCHAVEGQQGTNFLGTMAGAMELNGEVSAIILLDTTYHEFRYKM